MSSEGALRVALVGLGWWGSKMANLLAGAPDTIRVVRGIDTNLDNARALASKLGFALSDDYAEALSDPEIEAVILATPHTLHEAQIEQAVAAGKHVFCEKPLAMTRAGAVAAVARCEAAGLVLGMGHERRFEPPIAEILSLADSGALGTLMQIEANFSHDKFTLLDDDNWRLHRDNAPAAGMTATGIHLLDLSVRLMGPAASVLATCESLGSSLPQGDTVSAYIRFANSGTAYISASLATPFISRFAVFGRKGWIEVRDKAHVESPEGWVVTRGMADQPITVEEVPPAEAVLDNLEAFADAVRGRRPYPITGQQMIDDIALLEAIFRSTESGMVETISQ